MKQIVITVANHKGGVGKTTTAVTLATGLAGLGYSTVLIDADIQGHVAHFLNLDQRPALYEFIVMEQNLAQVGQAVPDYEALTVITGDEETLDITRNRRLKPTTALSNAIKRLPRTVQVIVIDTAPSITEIQFSALHAANWLLIPALPEFASETGITALMELIEPMKAQGIPIQTLGILPTMVQTRRNEHKETITDWKERLGPLLLPPIRNLTELGESPGRGLPIWSHAPNSQAAKDYARLLASVRKRTGLNGKA